MGKILQPFQASQEQQSQLSLKAEVEHHKLGIIKPIELSAELPYSIEAEQALLGCVLLTPAESMAECMVHALSESNFYFPYHQIIYKYFVSLWDKEKPINVISLVEALQLHGKLEEAGGTKFIESLSRETRI